MLRMGSFQMELMQVKDASGPCVRRPSEVAGYMRETAGLAQEAFCVLTINVKNRVIDKHLVTLGTLDATLVHAREIFRPAILDGARSIIICHNHPSGDPSPSAEDLRITRNLIEAGTVVDIKVMDHVIVVKDGGFCSLRETHMVDFD